MSPEMTPFDDKFAPVTSAIGFLRAPLDEAAEALRQWRADIHGKAHSQRLAGGLADNILRLEPLTSGVRPRELAVATANPEWTAVFDCNVLGSDPTSTVGYLAQKMQTHGVVVVSIPDVRPGPDRAERYGARKFELFGPIKTDFLNSVRSISLVRDYTRWQFSAYGTVQDFEETDAYQCRRKVDRFTPDMLRRYASALGLEPFDSAFYPGPSVLVTNPEKPPRGAWVLSIAETQRRYGIR